MSEWQWQLSGRFSGSDAWIPVARGRKPAVLIPHARWEPIPGAGRLVQEHAPAELAAVLGSFLRNVFR
ncbi:alpha/beta fold hydrolase [Streptomyces sp. KMM 9044]|uniref:alpha/beta fold hydrolase n=1 Tax=Streptomyces sp. KMM 9044 TaxID=2744474 RepID=UPI00216E3EC6